MIISRHLFKEVLYTTLIITSIIVFIFICQQLVRYLGLVAEGKCAIHLLLRLIALEIPVLFSLLLPIGLFLSLLLVYGRLYANSEMTALFASGFSRLQLLKITGIIALIVAIFVASLVFTINPTASNKRKELMHITQTTSLLQAVTPGRFQSFSNDAQVFYAKNIAKDNQTLQDLFMSEQSSNKEWTIFSAESGHTRLDEASGDHFLVLSNGYRYQGTPGHADFQVVQFNTHAIRLETPSTTARHKKMKELDIKTLWQSLDNLHYMAEWQWRLSMPLSVFVLSFLALPLSRVNPRDGQFKKLVPAVLIYVIYVNLLFISRNALESGIVPIWVGLWWPHALVLMLALLLWWKR